MADNQQQNSSSDLTQWGGDVPVVSGQIEMTKIEDVFAFAKWVIASGMVPSCFEQPAQVLVAVQTGAEVGLTAMASIQSVYVVNGAPAWRTRAAKGLIRNSGALEPGTDIESGVIHGAECTGKVKGCVDDCHGWCTSQRRGMGKPHRTEFSIADARRAGLYPADKSGAAWNKYTGRMLQHRAEGFEMDDGYSEVLLGLTTMEAVQDWPQAAFRRDTDGQLPSGAVPSRDPLFSTPGETVDVETGEVMDVDLARLPDNVDAVSGISEPSLGAEREAPTATEAEGAIPKVRVGHLLDICPHCLTEHPESDGCPPEPGAEEEPAAAGDEPVDVGQADLGLK